MAFLCSRIYLLVPLCSAMLVDSSDVIQGYYHAWWVPVPLPRDLVASGLPGNEFQLDRPNITGLSYDNHLVVFELGRETDCGPIVPAILRENFMEFKFEIPYIRHTSVNRVFDYKQIIYVDSMIESLGARLTYKLNSTVAKITMETDKYMIEKNGLHLSASFDATGNWGPPSAYPNFKAIEQIFSQRWFGSGAFDTCADHHYKFSTAQVRPSTATIKVDHNLLNAWFPAQKFKLPGIDHALGVAEVYVNFTMTGPLRCTD